MRSPPRNAYFNAVYYPTRELKSTTPAKKPHSSDSGMHCQPLIVEVRYDQPLAQPLSSSPRHPLPREPSSHRPEEPKEPRQTSPSPNRTTPKSQKTVSKKTIREKKRGEALLKAGIGQKAHSPCARCANNPDGCWVPTSDHVKKYNSLKCARCISQKTKCSFNLDNPGIEYPPKVLAEISHNEKNKQAGRAKALATNSKKQEIQLEKRRRSQEPPVTSGLEALEGHVVTSTREEPPAKGTIGKPPPSSCQAEPPTKKRRTGKN